MARSRLRRTDGSPADAGFTLLEVLVALAIVALGLTAAFGQLNQTLSAANRLRERSLAHWVAMDRMAELRLAGEFPAVGDRSDEIEMARVNWRYVIKVTQTPVENLRRVDISVAFAEQPERVVETLVGFLRRPATAVAAPLGTWLPVDPDRQTEGLRQ